MEQSHAAGCTLKNSEAFAETDRSVLSTEDLPDQ
jgi:hypothetical protein